MLGYQKSVVFEILDIAKHNQVDGIIIAGDVFDRSVPPAEAIALFSEFLRVASLSYGLKIFLIAGNHDSKTRLEFAADLLQSSNIYISKFSGNMLDPIVFQEDGKKFGIYLIPYLEPLEASRLFDKKLQSQNQIYEYIVNNLKQKNELDKKIIVAHLFTNGGITSESEKTLIGGLDGVSLNHFDGFDYVALGHLHGYQSPRPNVYYSGTPLKYSFSESTHKKSISLISISSNPVEVERIFLKQIIDLKIIEGYFDDIIIKSQKLPAEEKEKHFYKFKLYDDKPIYQVMSRLQKIFPKAVELIRATKAVACKDESDQKTKSQGDFSHELDDNPDTLKVIEDFFAKVEDYKLDEFERNLFENQIVRLSSNKI